MTSFIDALQAYNEKLSKMRVQDQISFEMKTAMKNDNPKLRDLMRVVMGEFAREGKELTDEQAIEVIKKMHKNATELGNDYEVAVLSRWVPKTLTEEETTRLIANIIEENEFVGIQSMGKVMAELKKHQGVDMKKANVWVKESLLND